MMAMSWCSFAIMMGSATFNGRSHCKLGGTLSYTWRRLGDYTPTGATKEVQCSRSLDDLLSYSLHLKSVVFDIILSGQLIGRELHR
jgi:hypothetical protein